MDDVKVQLTEENIQYKKKLNLSFANIINTLMKMARENSDIESRMLEEISKIKKGINII